MKCDSSLINRIKRAQGQLFGILNMMENESTCFDILTQLKAVRASVDKAIGILTTTNLIQLIEETNDIKLNNIDAAIDMVIKGVK